MSGNNSFNEVVNSMMQGMESFLSSKTVVGEPTQAGDTTTLQNVAKCSARHQEWTGAACQHQKSGYCHQDY